MATAARAMTMAISAATTVAVVPVGHVVASSARVIAAMPAAPVPMTAVVALTVARVATVTTVAVIARAKARTRTRRSNALRTAMASRVALATPRLPMAATTSHRTTSRASPASRSEPWR